MQIVVNGQSIAIVDDTLVSNSVNIYECEFEFDSSWDGFAKTSVWQLNSDDPIEVVIDSGVAVIPHEVLENAGILRIGVYGTKDEKVMPTVWGEKRKVHLGTPTGSIGTEPTPSIYAQILAVATEAKDIAEDVQTEWGSVSATAETLPSGSPASVEFENNTFAFGIPQGERGGDGADGFSPIVTVTPITNGHRVTITDAEGVHTFDVLDGADGAGITNIVMNADYTLTITLSNGTSFTTPSIRGEQGEQGETGNGISSITKTATVGKVDTYTITYTDGTTTTFDVTNGEVTEAQFTPVKSEVENIRVGADGTTYPTAGDAVRGQFSDVKSALNDISDALPTYKEITLNRKTLNIADGLIADSTTRLLSDAFVLHEGDYIKINSGYEFRILRFEADGTTYLANPISWSTEATIPTAIYANYTHRLNIRNSVDTSAELLPSEIEWEALDVESLPLEYSDVMEEVSTFVESKGYAVIDDNSESSEKAWSGAKIAEEIDSVRIADSNALGLWENGNIVTSTGASAESSSWLYPVSIRTKTFLSDKVYYVAVDRGWFLRAFKYKSDGTFVEWITGDNVTECFLSPQMKYRFQLVKEGASPSNPSTHISVADDSYTHVHFFEVKNAPSSFYKYLDFGVMQYGSYYTGMQSAYDINKNISYADFMTAWGNLVTGHEDYVTRTDLGAASDDQHLYLFDLNPSQINIDAHSALIAGSAEAVPVLPTIIITVCQHGNEKAAGFGAYYFIKDLLENWYGNGLLSYIRHHVRLLIIPVCNPYGWDNNLGVNANGVNTNRNFPYGWTPSAVEPFNQEYGGLAPLDQPESVIINNLLLEHSNAFHLCDFHTTGYTAPAVNEVAWVSYFETDDLYYNRLVNYARVYLKTFSAQMIREYNLNYGEDTILGMMIGGAGGGVLKNYASSLNVIGATLESTGEIYGMSEYHTPRSMKYSSELLGNWLGVVIDAYNK